MGNGRFDFFAQSDSPIEKNGELTVIRTGITVEFNGQGKAILCSYVFNRFDADSVPFYTIVKDMEVVFLVKNCPMIKKGDKIGSLVVERLEHK